MIKLTVLALFVALQQSSAEKETYENSRRLLQFGNPYYGPNVGYPQPIYNPCNPCNPYGGCYDANACWSSFQAQQPPPAAPPAQPVAPANPAPPVPPAPVDPTIPPPPPGNGPPPATNPGGAPPAGPAVNPGPGLPQIQPMPPVNPGPGLPGAPQPGGLYPVGPTGPAAPFNPMIPPMPFMGTGAMTDITCGPMPPAVPCANRNSGPTGAINPMTGLKYGPLNLGAGLANNAKLYCDTPGACANSDINWNVGPGIDRINQILCSEPGSCSGSTANIKNSAMNGNNVELSNLECGTGSCSGLTINGWGVSVNDVNCADPADCMNCNIRRMKTVPDLFCRDPYGPNAANNPNCAIEVTPCFGY